MPEKSTTADENKQSKMVQTRRRVRDEGGAASSEKRPRIEEDERPDDSEDELAQPTKALRGKHGNEIRELFATLLHFVDESELPYHSDHIGKKADALKEFAQFLNEIYRRDEDMEVPSDEEPEMISGEEEEEEEEMEDEGETEDDLEDQIDDLLESDEEEEEIEEEEADYYDDDGVEYIADDEDDE